MARSWQPFALALTLAAAGCAGADGTVPNMPVTIASPCRVDIPDANTIRDAFSDDRAARMEIGNDGGWCGWYDRLVFETGGSSKWFRAKLVDAPAHGSVRVRRDVDRVHVEYRPDPGYTGPDAFAVRLGPGFARRSATVTVTQASPGASAVSHAEVGVTTSTLDPDNIFLRDR